jgi:dienelactone hydrolase
MKLIWIFILFLISFKAFSQEIINYQSFWKKAAIDIKAELYLPTTGTAPFPVIFSIHNSGPDRILKASGGRTDVISLSIKKAGLDQGFAVILIDSFTARGLTRISEDVSQLSTRFGIIDIKRLLKAVEKDSRLDKSNFFLSGHSWGGSVALHLMHKTRWRHERHSPFKGIVAHAPGCQVLFEDDQLITTSLIIVGEKDDRTPASACVKKVKRIKEHSKNNIELIIVPKMYHSFSTSGVKWMANGDAINGCINDQLMLMNSGQFIKNGKPISQEEFYKSCITKGAWSIGNEELLPHVVDLTVNFYKSLIN